MHGSFIYFSLLIKEIFSNTFFHKNLLFCECKRISYKCVDPTLVEQVLVEQVLRSRWNLGREQRIQRESPSQVMGNYFRIILFPPNQKEYIYYKKAIKMHEWKQSSNTYKSWNQIAIL